MSDLRPLLEEDANSVEASILRQARAREPSPGAAGRALVVLGIAGAATTATAGAAAAPMAVLVAKWVGVGALSAVVILGGGQLATEVSRRSSANVSSVEPTRHAPSTSSSAAPPSPVAAPPIEEVLPPPVSTESAAASGLPLGAPRPVIRAPITAQSPEPSTPAVLDAEIALLDAARDAVAAHDPNRALRLLDDHRRQFPSGQLSQEATYVRVKALLDRGSRGEAELTARRFLESHPESPHAKRIRALLAQ